MNTSLKALTGDNDGNGISNVTDAFRKIYASIDQFQRRRSCIYRRFILKVVYV
jgi:hypothetical protein